MTQSSNGYKRHCAEPNVVTRVALKATINHIQTSRPDLGARLEAFLALPPIPKPERHAASDENDYIELPLGEAEFSEIARALGDVFLITKDSRVAALVHYWHGELRFSRDFQG